MYYIKKLVIIFIITIITRKVISLFK